MCFSQRAAAKCLCMGCLGSLSALWVNLWQSYPGPGAEVPFTHPKRICLAVQLCTKFIVAPTHAKKKSSTMLLNFKTQDVCLLYQRGSGAGLSHSSQGGTSKGLAKVRTCPHLPRVVCALYKVFQQHIVRIEFSFTNGQNTDMTSCSVSSWRCSPIFLILVMGSALAE